ncbi:MAG: Unknown protein [uncultured Aureispira sp.]|uniref:Uncharacterized protein n=1 Tax=uncultured Aureispira sp. TaxID=1331704 RepID=A0A6S6SWV4_9BACT|nr:MAG: Unknown protein [uncultured Aureispira sp.]
MNNLIFILLLLLCACQRHQTTLKNKDLKTTLKNEDLKTKMTNRQKGSLTEKLMTDHYGDFFNYAIQDEIISTIWAEAGGVGPLKAIVINEEAPTKARLLACEVLMKKEFTFLIDEDVKTDRVIAVYTDALANNTTGMANSWGLLYEHRDVGPVGIMLILFGEEAIPELVKLLDDETIHMYHGSKEATIGNGYQFRVKDFAAYYICRIKNTKAVYHKTHAARDKEIETLKVLLSKEQK